MSYVIDIRRRIHEYPEIGFELPKTIKLVKEELDKMGISYTEKYGKSSVVATLNEDKAHFTIGIRADMDALPIVEKTSVSYKSNIKGQMHACGHDAHTAIVLDVARRLAEIRDKIDCRVKFIFQPAEEFAPSGAKLMVEDNLMDDIDCIVALHVEARYSSGRIHLIEGPQNAISHGFHLDFYGKAAHAALQEEGIDTIAMAVKAYTAIEIMIAKELPANAVRIFNVGTINGGTANNVICDHTSMFCTLRTHDEAVEEKIMSRIKQIIAAVAKESGGRAKYSRDKYYPIVYNDAEITKKVRAAAEKVVGAENIGEHIRTSGGEDFSYYLMKKPGCMFRLGTRNEEKDCVYSAHQDRFNIDEDALALGSDVFVQFVLDNMNGIK